MSTDTENGHTEEAYWYVMRGVHTDEMGGVHQSWKEGQGAGAIRSGPAVCAF